MDVVHRHLGQDPSAAASTPPLRIREVAVFAERIRKTIADARFKPEPGRTSVLSGEEIRVTISIGIAAATDPHDQSMLQRADDAMYCAKKQGRNRVSIAPVIEAVKSLAA